MLNYSTYYEIISNLQREELLLFWSDNGPFSRSKYSGIILTLVPAFKPKIAETNLSAEQTLIQN